MVEIPFFDLLSFDRLTLGARVQKQDFSQGTTSYELRNLQPSTEYIITLFTLYDGREEATFFSTKPTGQRNHQLSETNCTLAHKLL